MKKSITTIVVLLCFVAGAYAQIPKGSVLLSGASNLGINSSKPKDGDSETTFTLDAKVGYFFTDNFTAGLALSYAQASDITSTGFGFFGRYYVNGKFFFGAGVESETTKIEIEDIFGSGNEEFKFNTTNIPLEIGYAAFIANNVAIEPSLSYTVVTGDAEGSVIGLNVGITLFLNKGE